MIFFLVYLASMWAIMNVFILWLGGALSHYFWLALIPWNAIVAAAAYDELTDK